MSATSSADVDKLKKLVLHNPVILTLSDITHSKDETIPKNVQQFLDGITSLGVLLRMCVPQIYRGSDLAES
ncbi:hypothetical protein ZIOFF_004246 [Zingiber officinale]|uniref:Uncharacterized protein n=1 Tax=Zingiber officinale TaxID=94328 RepID=A0A8J5IVF1_ZINOF|nr:hypothetical protein ZIOFF_004246 [Zingiber officinale]